MPGRTLSRHPLRGCGPGGGAYCGRMRFPLALLTVLALLAAGCSPAADPDMDAASDSLPVAVEEPTDEPAEDPAPEPEADPEPTEPAEPTEEPPADPLAMPAEGAPKAPDDAAAIAEILTAAEQAIRDPANSPEDLEAAGHWQQVIYRKLGHEPEWVEPVLAELPEELHAPVRANVFAGARLFAMHSPGATDPDEPVEIRELPGWRIIAPPPADELLGYYREAEAATGVPWYYLASVNLVETRMGRIRGDSVAGAQGPMQFMPATWGEWGEGDVQDHRDSIMAAGRFLRWGGLPGDPDAAIFRYNRDVRYVDAIKTYAEQMAADERAFYGYYHWQVYYFTGVENVWLPAGFGDDA
jgi:soluble lytic murein transglycosylase-like protein